MVQKSKQYKIYIVKSLSPHLCPCPCSPMSTHKPARGDLTCYCNLTGHMQIEAEAIYSQCSPLLKQMIAHSLYCFVPCLFLNLTMYLRGLSISIFREPPSSFSTVVHYFIMHTSQFI